MKSLPGFILLFLFGVTANATTLTVDAGIVTGATDIIEGNRSFDIVLVDGTCAGIFFGCNEDADFAPIEESDLLDLQNVLVSFLNEVKASPFDQSNILGCGAATDCRVYSPIGFNELAGNASTVLGAFTGTNIDPGVQGIDPSQNFADSDILTWAVITPTVIPIPAALWLFVSGLGLLCWIRRKAA